MDKPPCTHDEWNLAGWIGFVAGVGLAVFRCTGCGEHRCLGRRVA